MGVARLPAGYLERLVEIYPGKFRRLRLLVLDPYDLILSKLTRNSPVDQGDVELLARTLALDAETLRERYEREFRGREIGDPAWIRQTLEIWIEDYFER
ncbi:MAG: hypothetical protein FJ027_19990 [Candidatus Rokubacteria bacterium]|nr:hypothetical protein [Candidatus Rokubacteria bacterium]